MFDVHATWTLFGAASTPVSTLGWVVAGMVIIYLLKSLMDRSGRPTPAVVLLKEAARLNAARTAPPIYPGPRIPDIDDPRR